MEAISEFTRSNKRDDVQFFLLLHNMRSNLKSENIIEKPALGVGKDSKSLMLIARRLNLI